ncbi:MAG: ATP synthase F0 subunit B [Thermodesulfobacteriota bacterium]|nr:ATP synthase F0 subunit B [Thermodesulfobacteriota bacterium]
MISIDWTMLVQFVNFLVLMAVLNVLLYRPLRNVMNLRQEAVDSDLQKARDLESSISEKMENYASKLQQAKHEGSTESAAIRSEAAKHESVILGDARNAADKSLADLKSHVAVEAEEARKVLNKETKTLARIIASKVLGRKVK